MKQVLRGAIACQVGHEHFPDTFDRFSHDYLAGSNAGDRSVFRNPRPGYLTYRFVPPAVPFEELEDPSQLPVLYEVGEDGTIDLNGCIGYADGRVEGPAERVKPNESRF